MRLTLLVCLPTLILTATACGPGGPGGQAPSPEARMGLLDGGPGGTKKDSGAGEGKLTPGKKAAGALCSASLECQSGICHGGLCAAACSAPKDCKTGQECGSDDGKRTFCYTPAYNPAVGTSCAVSGKCPASLKCLGLGVGDAAAHCTASCLDDTDCPQRLTCRQQQDGSKLCVKRDYCAACQHTGQCNDGHTCLAVGARRFCLKPCSSQGSECPAYASCQTLAGGRFCVHKAGTCVGNGSLCAPCGDARDCQAGGRCLTFTGSGESFCASSCAGGAACPGGYTCNAQYSACVPAQKSSCVASLSPVMQVGAVMDDYAMVGYTDANGDGSLSGEALTLVRLSQVALGRKVVLFTLSAGWCSSCKAETGHFKALLGQFSAKGLAILQTLVDNTQQGTLPTVSFLDAWISQLGAVGAVGIDPRQAASRYNTDKVLPLNILVDATSMKVLEKWSGSTSDSAMQARLSKHLP